MPDVIANFCRGRPHLIPAFSTNKYIEVNFINPLSKCSYLLNTGMFTTFKVIKNLIGYGK